MKNDEHRNNNENKIHLKNEGNEREKKTRFCDVDIERKNINKYLYNAHFYFFIYFCIFC